VVTSPGTDVYRDSPMLGLHIIMQGMTPWRLISRFSSISPQYRKLFYNCQALISYLAKAK